MKTYSLRRGTALAEIMPERGGLITRFAVGGDEVLYLDEATLADPTKNVRGGIPILFPCAGKPPRGVHPGLKQHGFARNLPFQVTTADETSLSMELSATAETRAVFPFDFRLTLTVDLQDTSLALKISIVNTGTEPMPVHFGLHPYFYVPVAAKGSAVAPTAAKQAFDNTSGESVTYRQPNFGTGETDLHLLDHGSFETTLSAPGLTTRHIAWDAFLPILVLWTQPDKPFICVEPWSALTGELDSPRHLLAPGASTGGTFRMSVTATAS